MAKLTLEEIEKINNEILERCEQLHSFLHSTDEDDYEEEWLQIYQLKEAMKNFGNDEWSY